MEKQDRILLQLLCKLELFGDVGEELTDKNPETKTSRIDLILLIRAGLVELEGFNLSNDTLDGFSQNDFKNLHCSGKIYITKKGCELIQNFPIGK